MFDITKETGVYIMLMNVFGGILIPFVGTTPGAACVFFMRQTLNKSVQRALAGFAAGIMVAASIWSILIPHAHIPYQKVTDMHLWQLCHLAMVVPIADAYYESDDPEKVEKEWKMNIFRFLPSPFLAIMLAVTFGSSFMLI